MVGFVGTVAIGLLIMTLMRTKKKSLQGNKLVKYGNGIEELPEYNEKNSRRILTKNYDEQFVNLSGFYYLNNDGYSNESVTFLWDNNCQKLLAIFDFGNDYTSMYIDKNNIEYKNNDEDYMYFFVNSHSKNFTLKCYIDYVEIIKSQYVKGQSDLLFFLNKIDYYRYDYINDVTIEKLIREVKSHVKFDK